MLLRYGNHNDPERIAFCLELERKWQETEMMTPSPSLLLTDSIPEAEATIIEETDSCLVTDHDHVDDDDNDHDDSVLVQEAQHYEETILEIELTEISESILMIESKPEEEVESKPEDDITPGRLIVSTNREQLSIISHKLST
ncbi:hypothetical protein Bca4012_054603 [Brassica carinata]